MKKWPFHIVDHVLKACRIVKRSNIQDTRLFSHVPNPVPWS